MGINTVPEIFHKSPDEVEIKIFDFTNSQDISTGETLQTVAATSVTPAGELTVTNPAIENNQVQVTLSGGEVGTTYSVLIRVTTSAGQTLEAVGRMVVAES